MRCTVTRPRHDTTLSLSPRGKGYESLFGFRICFYLGDAVMLDTVVSVVVGLSNRRHSGRLRVWV
jgi:hypothetical protein